MGSNTVIINKGDSCKVYAQIPGTVVAVDGDKYTVETSCGTYTVARRYVSQSKNREYHEGVDRFQNRYRARRNGVHLGMFSTPEEAADAYLAAEEADRNKVNGK